MTENETLENQGFQDSVVELDSKNVCKIFKKIKDRGVLNNSINEKVVKVPPKELLESGELIDVIKYYRLKKGWSRLELCKRANVCDTSYRYYEAKTYEIQDYRVAERLVNALDIKDKVKMPDEFLIKKNYPMNKVIEIINKYGKKEFSKRTGIAETTINTWMCKGAPNELANTMYKKMVKLFKEDNIKYNF